MVSRDATHLKKRFAPFHNSLIPTHLLSPFSLSYPLLPIQALSRLASPNPCQQSTEATLQSIDSGLNTVEYFCAQRPDQHCLWRATQGDSQQDLGPKLHCGLGPDAPLPGDLGALHPAPPPPDLQGRHLPPAGQVRVPSHPCLFSACASPSYPSFWCQTGCSDN